MLCVLRKIPIHRKYTSLEESRVPERKSGRSACLVTILVKRVYILPKISCIPDLWIDLVYASPTLILMENSRFPAYKSDIKCDWQYQKVIINSL